VHGRSLPGKRVVLHLTCNRKNIRPIESYYHIDATILERNPPVLRQMLGFDDSWDRKGQRLVPRSTSHHPRKSEPEATHR
jgi:hypothetical protein